MRQPLEMLHVIIIIYIHIYSLFNIFSYITLLLERSTPGLKTILLTSQEAVWGWSVVPDPIYTGLWLLWDCHVTVRCKSQSSVLSQSLFLIPEMSTHCIHCLQIINTTCHKLQGLNQFTISNISRLEDLKKLANNCKPFFSSVIFFLWPNSV